ncbi:MAG: hypothetical protein AAFN92_14235, partial [Bacteroidota bacterium]
MRTYLFIAVLACSGWLVAQDLPEPTSLYQDAKQIAELLEAEEVPSLKIDCRLDYYSPLRLRVLEVVREERMSVLAKWR